MKPNSFLFLVLLGFSSLSLAMSSIDESNVKSYFVVRKVWNPDLFRVNMKYGSQCAKGMTLKAWCDALGAITGEVSANRRSCSCTCPSDESSFLPSLRRCISKGQLPANFGGCLNHTDAFLIGRTVLKFPVDLDQKKERKTSVSLKDYKCSLYGYYFDYNGFQIRWKNVTSGIFKLKQKGREKIVSIEGQDKNGHVSGRIIKLYLFCSNITLQIKPKLEYCYLFKAQGSVTHYAPARNSSVYAVPTALNSHTPSSLYSFSPSLGIPQSTQTSLLSSKPQQTSLPSPSPGATTRSPATHTGVFSTFVSAHVETRSLQTKPALHSTGPILSSTSTAELESSLPVNSGEISNQVVNTGIPKSSVSTGEPNYSEPSEICPLT